MFKLIEVPRISSSLRAFGSSRNGGIKYLTGKAKPPWRKLQIARNYAEEVDAALAT